MSWKITKKSNILVLAAAILCAALVLVVIFGEKGKSEVVAKVNGYKITKTQLYDLMVKQNGQQALDSLISERIVNLESQKQNIIVSEEDIQKELGKYYEYYGGQESFTQTLASSGYSINDVRKDLELSLKIRKLMEPRISIIEDELKTYFDENKESFAQGKQVKASHILVDTQEKANEIEKRLANGEDFAGLARENSTDTTTRDNGGELGFFSKGQMTEDFEAAAFALKAGQISTPVKTAYGYHIIKVEEIKEAQEANYEQSKDKIYDTLLEQKVETEYNTWIQEMYQQYEIQNFLKNR